MKNKSKEILKAKGITLVALVVTIVILLILAGITINFILGPNSIFNIANEAKNRTGLAEFEEKLGMAYADAILERRTNGGLIPEKYFESLKNYEIISDTTVGGENISNATENADGSKTYKITSDNEYVFEATIYPDGRVETEIIGKDGNIEAKVRSIAVTNKTQTSIEIIIGARLQGYTIKAYYKKAVDVAENEPEESIEGYTEITLNDKLEGIASGLTAREEYKIKAILRNGEEVLSVKSINEKPLILVESITLNKTSLTLNIDEKEVLIADIMPNDASDKTVKWSSSSPDVASVNDKGEVTGLKVGNTTITVTVKNSENQSASCEVTIKNEPKEITYSWEELEKIAKAISNIGTYDENTRNIKVTVDGEIKTLKVGDWKKIDGRRVRILGFNHDTLTSNTAYGETTITGKAGISFEYLDSLIDNARVTGQVTSAGGWIGRELYNTLNTNEDAKYIDIQEKGIPIKQVQKTYNATYTTSDLKTSNDYLWLLSCTEIWGDSADTANGCVSGLSRAEEGKQYAFYANCTPKPVYNSNNDNVKHYSIADPLNNIVWLRSPNYKNYYHFCNINRDGYCSWENATSAWKVCPGFCI